MYQRQKCTECGHYMVIGATKNTLTCVNKSGKCSNVGRSFRVPKINNENR